MYEDRASGRIGNSWTDQRIISVSYTHLIESDELIKILDAEDIEYTTMDGGLAWVQPWFGYVFLPIGILALAGGIALLMMSQKGGQGAAASVGSSAQSGAGRVSPVSYTHLDVYKRQVWHGTVCHRGPADR